MEHGNTRDLLAAYNVIYKEADEVYRRLAQHYGLSYCALWILYYIRECNGSLTQREVCEMLSRSKQTVNSALKGLERAGYIRLGAADSSGRGKRIALTEAGEALARTTVDAVMGMEQCALASLTEGEQAEFLRLYRKYVFQLQKEGEKVLQASSSRADCGGGAG